MDSKMKIYEELRHVPVEATKPIDTGRLAGMTSVTPQWRYQRLTELFGPCGVGWKISTPEYNFWKLEDKAQAIVFCSVNLYIRGDDGNWSDPIPGEGGSLLYVRNYTTNEFEPNDDAKKSALTDAIGTAAKLLGLGADIYFRTGDGSKYRDDTDHTPYGVPEDQPAPAQASPQSFAPPAQPPTAQSGYQQQMPSTGLFCADCGQPISTSVANKANHDFGRPLCMSCQNAARQMNANNGYQQIPAQPIPMPTPMQQPLGNQQQAWPAQSYAQQQPNPGYAASPAAPAPTMTREQARAFVIPVGEYRGKTIGEILNAGNKLTYYQQERFKTTQPDLYEAVRVALGK